MKRIVATLFLLALLLIATAVIAPSFIDWNKHKDIIISRLEQTLDRDIDVAGDVSFRILPNPQIRLQNVSIAAVKGARNPYLLTLKQMEGKVRLKPLLEGRLEVESFHLTAPELTLEVLEDGQISWGIKKTVGGGAFTAVELQNVSVTDGKIRYLRHDSGADIVLDHLNFSLNAERLAGPYVVKGDMRYKNIPVNVELTSRAKNNTGLYPLTVLLQPVDVLPQIRFDGLTGVAKGLVLDGDVELDGGSIGSLFNDDFSNAAGFMRQAAHIKAGLLFKDRKIDLTISEGTWDGKGKLEGKITAELAGVEKPLVTADLSGTTLLLSRDADGYIPVPAGYDVAAKLKFLDVTWKGARFPGLTLDAKTQNDEWIIEGSRLDLNARGGVQFSGVVTPKQEMATWNISLNTPDMGAAFAHLATDAAPVLTSLADASMTIPLSLSGNLDQRKDRISLYNFTAKSGEDHAVSGVLNLRAGGAVEAKLTVPKLLVDKIPVTVRNAFMQALMKQKLDMELAAADVPFGKVALKDIKMKLSGDGGKLAIAGLSGQTGEAMPFDLKGVVTAWPIGQGDFDLQYRLQTKDAAAWGGMMGVPLPSPLQNARTFDVSGQWKQDQVARTVTAVGEYQGGMLDMISVQPRSTTDQVWKNEVKMKLPESGLLFSTFGLPHDRLLLPSGSATFTGVIDGGHIKGAVKTDKNTVNVDIRMAADNSSVADIATDFVDMNTWFAQTPTVYADTEMALQAKKIFWRGITVENVVADTVLQKNGFAARKLSGLLWGGQLDVSAAARREDKTWQGRVTGTVKNADLSPLLTMTGLKGIAVGRGDVVFDLEGGGDTKGLLDTTGKISLTLDSLTLDAFDPVALADFIREQESLPDDLGTYLHKAMRENGGSTFVDVSVDLKVADNKVEIANLTLGNADVNMQVSGLLDLKAESYDVTAETVLKNLPDIGGLTITRKGAAGDAPDYRFDIGGIKSWIESRILPPVVEGTPVITDAPYATPDMPETGVEAVPLNAPPSFEDNMMMPPADDRVEVEELASPQQGADTRDTLQGILDRLDDAPPAEDEILPPE